MLEDRMSDLVTHFSVRQKQYSVLKRSGKKLRGIDHNLGAAALVSAQSAALSNAA